MGTDITVARRIEYTVGMAFVLAAAAVAACSDSRGTCFAGAMGGASGGGGGPYEPWPTGDPVVTVDDAGEFTGNLSGLAYEPGVDGASDVLWGVRNAPSVLYRLAWSGGIWTSVTDGDWLGGKRLRFPDGTAEPDSEGVTLAEGTTSAVYVSTERQNEFTARRFSIVRFDTAEVGNKLIATHEWDLTADLPVVNSNLGIEGITWVPDAFLVASAFFDEDTSTPYTPAHYAQHGTGLFFIALEANGMIYGYALDHAAGGFTRVATIDSGQPTSVELTFDGDTGALWSYCDIACHNKAAVLAIDSTGRFTPRRFFAAPTDLPDSNNEGFAIARACQGGTKKVWWADDSDTAGHSIRQGTLPCNPLSSD